MVTVNAQRNNLMIEFQEQRLVAEKPPNPGLETEPSEGLFQLELSLGKFLSQKVWQKRVSGKLLLWELGSSLSSMGRRR